MVNIFEFRELVEIYCLPLNCITIISERGVIQDVTVVFKAYVNDKSAELYKVKLKKLSESEEDTHFLKGILLIYNVWFPEQI